MREKAGRGPRARGALKVAKARLEAMSERQVDAYLKLQICRKHRQLQRRILDQSAAALARAEQRKTVIGEEVGVLRNELGRHWNGARASGSSPRRDLLTGVWCRRHPCRDLRMKAGCGKSMRSGLLRMRVVFLNQQHER